MKKERYSILEEEKIKVPAFNEKAGLYASKQSSFTMSRIRAKNTKPELKLRKALWNRGLRYRLNKKGLIGKPDLIFASKRVVVFVDGDFWHGYNWEQKKEKLKTNKSYWIPKIERNMQRDREVTNHLQSQGWIVLRFWENQINKDFESCIEIIEQALIKSSI